MKIVPVKSNEHTTTKREKLLYRIRRARAQMKATTKISRRGEWRLTPN